MCVRAVLCAVLSSLLSLSLPHTNLSSRARGGGRESTREQLVERVSAARASVARGRDGCDVIVVRCGAGHSVVRACVRARVPARPRAYPRTVATRPSFGPTLKPTILFRDFLFSFPFSFLSSSYISLRFRLFLRLSPASLLSIFAPSAYVSACCSIPPSSRGKL